ncbi:MAG: molybdopterin-synthase adenylyltransferase MoeB [Gammaproteobacteria bacterium]|nr:molybdopterin-synthase adenylyltransferase MoeB [Gammaproteobacteria bacterium]
MNDDQLLRYSRQIMLPMVDAKGQQRLLESTAMIVGLGGLGSPVAMYLAAAGVGRLLLIDFDQVEISNLQRQVIHATADIGRLKVESAQDTLKALNPEVAVESIPRKLEVDELTDMAAKSNVIIDASDNFATRFALNQVSVATRTPLVSGAAIRMEGQVGIYRPELPESPCYRCLYKDENELQETCTQTGVLAPVLGIIGSIQATEALKILIDIGQTLTGRLLLLDAMTMEWRTLKLNRDPDCPVCGISAN